MRTELISLRSRAEGKQSSERLTTSSLWRNTSTLEYLISFSCWGSEWILSVCFLKMWLSVSPRVQSSAERSQGLSHPLVVIGRAVIYCARWWEVTGQRPQSPGGLFNHTEWALIPPLGKFELRPLSFMCHAVTQLMVSSLLQVARFSLWTLLHVFTTQHCCWTGPTHNLHLNIQKLIIITTNTKIDF